MKYYFLVIIFVAGLGLTLSAQKASAFNSCFVKSNGRFSFGDANKDYSDLISCKAASSYYDVVKSGLAVDCMLQDIS